MPESESNVFCLEIADRVTLSIYENVLEPAVRKIIAEYGDIKILLYYSGPFPGWDIDAAARDLQAMTELGRSVKKVALVNPPEQVLLRWQTLKPLVGGEIKFFTIKECKKALDWVKS